MKFCQATCGPVQALQPERRDARYSKRCIRGCPAARIMRDNLLAHRRRYRSPGNAGISGKLVKACSQPSVRARDQSTRQACFKLDIDDLCARLTVSAIRCRICAAGERTAEFCDTTKRRCTKPVVPDDCTAPRQRCSTAAELPGTTSTTSNMADSSSSVRVMYLRPGTNLGSRSSWLVVQTRGSQRRGEHNCAVAQQPL